MNFFRILFLLSLSIHTTYFSSKSKSKSHKDCEVQEEKKEKQQDLAPRSKKEEIHTLPSQPQDKGGIANPVPMSQGAAFGRAASASKPTTSASSARGFAVGTRKNTEEEEQ